MKVLDTKLLGQMLKKKRRELKLTQDKLAAEIGMSRTHIADMERGKNTPSLKTLLIVLDVLGTDICCLSGIELLKESTEEENEEI